MILFASPHAKEYSATYPGTFLVIILWGGVGSCRWLVAGGQGSSAWDGPTSENDVAPHVPGAQTEKLLHTRGPQSWGDLSRETAREGDHESSGPGASAFLPSHPWLCCPCRDSPARLHPLLRPGLPASGRSGGKKTGSATTAGEPEGGSPGKLSRKKRLWLPCSASALQRPYLHPHRWASHWTGCCRLLGSGLYQDRRHHRQGSPSHCHRWTWGAWWCWERGQGSGRPRED